MQSKRERETLWHKIKWKLIKFWSIVSNVYGWSNCENGMACGQCFFSISVFWGRRRTVAGRWEWRFSMENKTMLALINIVFCNWWSWKCPETGQSVWPVILIKRKIQNNNKIPNRINFKRIKDIRYKVFVDSVESISERDWEHSF